VYAATWDRAERRRALSGKTLDFPLPACTVYKFYKPNKGRIAVSGRCAALKK